MICGTNINNLIQYKVLIINPLYSEIQLVLSTSLFFFLKKRLKGQTFWKWWRISRFLVLTQLQAKLPSVIKAVNVIQHWPIFVPFGDKSRSWQLLTNVQNLKHDVNQWTKNQNLHFTHVCMPLITGICGVFLKGKTVCVLSWNKNSMTYFK